MGTGPDAEIGAGDDQEAYLCVLIPHTVAAGRVVAVACPPLTTFTRVSLLPRTGRGASRCTLFKTVVLPAGVRGW